MTPPPSPRLACWRLEDAPALRRALDLSDAHLRPWVPFMRGEPRTLAETTAVIRRAIAQFEAGPARRFAVWDGDALVGEVMLIDRAGAGLLEVGYWMHVEHCGRGLATAATRAVTRVAFDDPAVEGLIFRCDTRNAASNRIPARLGAQLAAVEPAAGLDDPNEPVQLNVWRLSRWAAPPS